MNSVSSLPLTVPQFTKRHVTTLTVSSPFEKEKGEWRVEVGGWIDGGCYRMDEYL